MVTVTALSLSLSLSLVGHGSWGGRSDYHHTYGISMNLCVPLHFLPWQHDGQVTID
jgi:hypothetical protein